MIKIKETTSGSPAVRRRSISVEEQLDEKISASSFKDFSDAKIHNGVLKSRTANLWFRNANNQFHWDPEYELQLPYIE